MSPCQEECVPSRKRNLDGQPVVTDSVYFIRNPACSNYGNTQAAPAPKKMDHLLQVRSLTAFMHLTAHMPACCACVLRPPGPLRGLLCCT